MAQTFLYINDTPVQCPSTGLEVVISTAVNSGRNANNEVVGEVVGRNVLKYNNLQWAWLEADEWHKICALFSSFFVTARIWNPEAGGWTTLKMYPGDRSAEIYWLNEDGTPKNYRNCKVNIIDCGIIG